MIHSFRLSKFEKQFPAFYLFRKTLGKIAAFFSCSTSTIQCDKDVKLLDDVLGNSVVVITAA